MIIKKQVVIRHLLPGAAYLGEVSPLPELGHGGEEVLLLLPEETAACFQHFPGACVREPALEQVSDPGRNSGRRSGGCRTAENPLPQAKWVTSANPSTLPFLSPIGWISSQWL